MTDQRTRRDMAPPDYGDVDPSDIIAFEELLDRRLRELRTPAELERQREAARVTRRRVKSRWR